MIGIIALLLAMLLPTPQRVKKQAKAVVCQTNLHQWGIRFLVNVAENDSRLANMFLRFEDVVWFFS